MPKSTNQKRKILYLMQILLEQTDEDHFLSLSQLTALLAQRGIEAERKSLYDDLEQLRQFGIDVETHIIDEEYFRTRVTVCTSPNFYRWIFGWAGNVIIEEPQSVVDEYQLMLKAAQEAQHDIAKGK